MFSYEERYKALETITQNLQEPTTFEDFCMQLCCTGVPSPAAGSSGSLSGNLINLFYSKTQNQFFCLSSFPFGNVQTFHGWGMCGREKSTAWGKDWGAFIFLTSSTYIHTQFPLNTLLPLNICSFLYMPLSYLSHLSVSPSCVYVTLSFLILPP